MPFPFLFAIVSCFVLGSSTRNEPKRGAAPWYPIEREIYAHKDEVAALAVSDDESTFATAGKGQIKLWRLKDGKQLATWTLEEKDEWVRSLQFSKSGRFLVSTDHNGTLTLWDVKKGAVVVALKDKRFDLLRPKLSPNEKSLVIAGQDGTKTKRATIRFYDFSPSSKKLRFRFHVGCGLKEADEFERGYVAALVYSPDGKELLSFTRNSDFTKFLVQMWDAKTGERKWAHVSAEDRSFWTNFSAELLGVSFSRDGKSIFCCGQNWWPNAKKKEGEYVYSEVQFRRTDGKVLKRDAVDLAELERQAGKKECVPFRGMCLLTDGLLAAVTDNWREIWFIDRRKAKTKISIFRVLCGGSSTIIDVAIDRKRLLVEGSVGNVFIMDISKILKK